MSQLVLRFLSPAETVKGEPMEKVEQGVPAREPRLLMVRSLASAG